MGQLKKLDISGFLSRTEGGHLELTYRESFLRADKLLVDIDEILGSCGIEGVGSIGYVSLEPQISKIYEDVLVLANYPSELTFEFSSVDDDFAHDVQDAVNALSTIKIDDIRIKNEFGVTYTEESFDGFEYVYDTRMKDSISLTDFIGGGYTGLRREETTFVEGFTDVIYSRFVTDDKDLKTIIAEKSKEIDSSLHGAEFNAASYQPAKEMLSQTLEITSMGIYPLMECVAGYDLITKEILTDDEMGRLMFMMGLELTFVPLMMGKGFAQFFINLAASAGGAVTSVTTAKLCEEMGATELQTFLISSLVGLAAGYALHCSGESVYEFYKQHKNEIASNMAKNASDNAGSLVEEMVDEADDLAVESQYKNTDTLTKPSGVLDDAADDLAVKKQGINLDKTSYGKSSEIIKNKFPNDEIPADGYKLDYYISDGKIKGINGRKGNFDFIITKDGQLLIGSKHHYLGNAGDVVAAGQIKINGQGAIKRIDNLSGHYQPTLNQAINYQALFEQQGLSLNKTWLEYYYIPIDTNGYCADTVLEYIEMIEEVK